VKPASARLIVVGLSIACVAFLLIGIFISVNQEESRVSFSNSPASQLTFKRTVYDARQETALSKLNATIVLAGPTFRPEGTPIELVEMSPDLVVTGSRELDDPFFYASASEDKNTLLFMGGGCRDASRGWANCSVLTALTKESERANVSSKDLGLDFHEYEPDGSGGFWAIKYVSVPCGSVNTKNCGNDVDGQPVAAIGDCNIVHVVEGEIVSTWSAYDHLPDGETTSARYGEASDIFHCNSIESFDVKGEDKLLISMRNTDSLYLVDVASGNVDWKLGGNEWPKTSLALENPGALGLTAASPSAEGQVLSGQHDARYWGNGIFSVFDNGSKTGRPARGIVFTVDVDRGTATIKQVFNDPDGNPSGCTGSFRQLDRGAYWLAGWGCSASGVTVFAADTTPIVSAQLDQTSPSTIQRSDEDWGLLRWSLSYRVTVE
jgi:hypothetical protein